MASQHNLLLPIPAPDGGHACLFLRLLKLAVLVTSRNHKNIKDGDLGDSAALLTTLTFWGCLP